ncbi:hypothetical protein KEM55_007027, partial [Ascosphaera atra]
MTPYLLQEALVGHKTGTPVMRPMFLEFPEDLNTYAIDTQYMFGSNLLVAPVFTEEGKVSFYVPYIDDASNPDPNAKWVSWFDHSKTYECGRWYTEVHDFNTLPILIRPGSVTAVNYKIKAPEEDPFDGLEFLVNNTIPVDDKITIVNPEATHEVLKVIPFSSAAAKEGEKPASLVAPAL